MRNPFTKSLSFLKRSFWSLHGNIKRWLWEWKAGDNAIEKGTKGIYWNEREIQHASMIFYRNKYLSNNHFKLLFPLCYFRCLFISIDNILQSGSYAQICILKHYSHNNYANFDKVIYFYFHFYGFYSHGILNAINDNHDFHSFEIIVVSFS